LEEEETIIPYEDDSGEMPHSVTDIDNFIDDSYHKFIFAKVILRGGEVHKKEERGTPMGN
jgi:hypothetical protein